MKKSKQGATLQILINVETGEIVGYETYNGQFIFQDMNMRHLEKAAGYFEDSMRRSATLYDAALIELKRRNRQ